MNLQPINPPAPVFKFFCFVCNEQTSSSSGYADLDGEPFKAYFCRTCAAGLKSTAINRGQQPLDLD